MKNQTLFARFIIIISSVLILQLCFFACANKDSSTDPAPPAAKSSTYTPTTTTSGTATSTRTSTPTGTVTSTGTATPTATITTSPTVTIYSTLKNDEGSIQYYTEVYENNTRLATGYVEIDDTSDASPPIQLTPFGTYYENSGAYDPGHAYQLKVLTCDGRTFTASIASAPGSYTISPDKTTVSWAYPGTTDSGASWVWLLDGDWNSLENTQTITSPANIAYSYVTGNYILLVQQDITIKSFTGDGINSTDSFFRIYCRIKDTFSK